MATVREILDLVDVELSDLVSIAPYRVGSEKYHPNDEIILVITHKLNGVVTMSGNSYSTTKPTTVNLTSILATKVVKIDTDGADAIRGLVKVKDNLTNG